MIMDINMSIVNSSSSGSSDADSYSHFMGSTFGEFFLVLIKGVFGLVATAENVTIFILLCLKDKQAVSELLVIANSLLDSVLSVIFVIKVTLSPLLVLLPAFYLCVFQYFLYTYLTTASFFLIMAISVNRYVAVRRPFEYKEVFSLLRVRLGLAAVLILSGIHSSPEIGVCMGMFPNYQHYWLFSRVFFVFISSAVLIGKFIKTNILLRDHKMTIGHIKNFNGSQIPGIV